MKLVHQNLARLCNENVSLLACLLSARQIKKKRFQIKHQIPINHKHITCNMDLPPPPPTTSSSTHHNVVYLQPTSALYNPAVLLMAVFHLQQCTVKLLQSYSPPCFSLSLTHQNVFHIQRAYYEVAAVVLTTMSSLSLTKMSSISSHHNVKLLQWYSLPCFLLVLLTKMSSIPSQQVVKLLQWYSPLCLLLVLLT